jgi:hypothetical protein
VVARGRFIGVVLSLLIGGGIAGTALAQGDKAAAPVGAQNVAMVLEHLKSAGSSPLVRIDSSCATSCGSGPQGSCTKSCPAPQSCQASCTDGKAVCSCN